MLTDLSSKKHSDSENRGARSVPRKLEYPAIILFPASFDQRSGIRRALYEESRNKEQCAASCAAGGGNYLLDHMGVYIGIP